MIPWGPVPVCAWALEEKGHTPSHRNQQDNGVKKRAWHLAGVIDSLGSRYNSNGNLENLELIVDGPSGKNGGPES